jgi:hypothetical protein
MNSLAKDVIAAAWRAVGAALEGERRAQPRSIDESVPAPVLKFPVISHDEVMSILADKPGS